MSEWLYQFGILIWDHDSRAYFTGPHGRPSQDSQAVGRQPAILRSLEYRTILYKTTFVLDKLWKHVSDKHYFDGGAGPRVCAPCKHFVHIEKRELERNMDLLIWLTKELSGWSEDLVRNPLVYHWLCWAIVNWSVCVYQGTYNYWIQIWKRGTAKSWQVQTFSLECQAYSFHIVVNGLLRSLLNFKFHQKLWPTIWKHEWNFWKDKQRPSKTANDWVAGVDS